ncbi:MAG: threonine synthase [Bacillota bacterium]|jgi:threonine synthase
MKYYSTRSKAAPLKAAEAIFLGMAPDGGLFVPESFPHYLPQQLADLTYRELAEAIFALYLDDYSSQELAQMVEDAYYSGNFDAAIAPTITVGEKELLELWHGPTAAFKDMALQIMPHFLTAAVKKTGSNKEVVILVATSGDTGKAALEGFKDVKGVKIIVFYPAGGVSRIQELQMLTTTGNNTYVVGINGNFDHCQTAVKEIFADTDFAQKMAEAGKQFSSANSINWGRLLPQIVYYYYAYGQMVAKGRIKNGEKINAVVPTGNFGDILAAYYAKRMGLPLDRLICASNENNVLTEVITTGKYDRRRPFYKTTSPSMDILVSSNFERFIFDILEQDNQQTATAFKKLKEEGSFVVAPEVVDKWQEFLAAGFADQAEVQKIIAQVFQKHQYLMDPHTAVAYAVAEKYQKKTGDKTPLLVVSTASPYKFPTAVLQALDVDIQGFAENDLPVLLAEIASGKVHPALLDLDKKEIRHHLQADKSQIAEKVASILEIS